VSKWLRIVLFETVNVRLYINIIQNKTRIESENSFSNIDHSMNTVHNEREL